MPAAVLIPVAISAGSAALQFLLTPRIKQQPQDRGKMDDIRIQGSDYGAFIPRTWGKTRMAGNVIASTGVSTYVVQTGGAGGKKGGQAPTNDYIYKTSVAILHSRNQIESFLRIWAGVNLLADNTPSGSGKIEAEDATLSGGANAYVDPTASSGDAVQGLGNGGKAVFDFSVVPDPSAPGGDADQPHSRTSFIYKCPVDRTATVTVVDNDTAATVVYTISFPASSEWTAKTVIWDGFVGTLTFENASADAPNLDLIQVEKYWTTNPDPGLYRITGVLHPNIGYPTDIDDPSEYYNYDPELLKNGSTGTYSLDTPIPGTQVRFYTGTETQTADPKILAWLQDRFGPSGGTARASGNRGLSYVVIQDLTLKESQLPNFTFETTTDDYSTNTILTDLFTDVGLSAGDYDISATSSLSQIGFIENTARSRKALIEDLERYHFFRIAEIDGKIKTIPDSYVSVGNIDADLLRAHDASEEMPTKDAEVVEGDTQLLPKEVSISVMQPELEYHNESVPARLFTATEATASVEYAFPIVDPASVARQVGEKMLLKAHSENTAYEIMLMPEAAKYSVGDVINVSINGVGCPMRIEKKQITLPLGEIRAQCVSISPFAPTYFQTDVTRSAPKSVTQFVRNNFPRNSIVVPIQSQPIREADVGRLGLYLAVCGRGRGDGTDASLYRETATENFELQKQNVVSSPVGVPVEAHSSDTDPDNPLIIYFFDDIELESVTAEDVARNPLLNLIRIGEEWMQFESATAVSLPDNSPYRSAWQLNIWSYGKFGTSDKRSTHVADEYATVYTPFLQFYDLETADIGLPITLKAVTSGQSVDVAPKTSFIFENVANGGSKPASSVLFDHYEDAGSLATELTALYTDVIPANTLSTPGDKIVVEYAGVFGDTGSEKTIIITWANAEIYNSVASVPIGASYNNWRINVTIVNIDGASFRSIVSVEVGWDFHNTPSDFNNVKYSEFSSDATQDNNLALSALATDDNEIVAKMGYGLFIPAMETTPTTPTYITDDSGVYITTDDGKFITE